MNKHRLFSPLLKEPLLHFLLIGMGLFFLFAQLNEEEKAKDTQEIIMNKSKLAVLSATFIEESGKLPTNIELKELVENNIKDEILYYEAMAIGLDKEDKVIKHRLAEKMKYLFEDVSMADDPSEKILKAYLQDNSEQFTKPYNEIKSELKQAWIEEEQRKENEAFYQNLKSRYQITMSDEVRKVLDISVPK